MIAKSAASAVSSGTARTLAVAALTRSIALGSRHGSACIGRRARGGSRRRGRRTLCSLHLRSAKADLLIRLEPSDSTERELVVEMSGRRPAMPGRRLRVQMTTWAGVPARAGRRCRRPRVRSGRLRLPSRSQDFATMRPRRSAPRSSGSERVHTGRHLDPVPVSGVVSAVIAPRFDTRRARDLIRSGAVPRDRRPTPDGAGSALNPRCPLGP